MKTKTLARLLTLTLLLSIGLMSFITISATNAAEITNEELKSSLNTLQGESGLPGTPNGAESTNNSIAITVGRIIKIFLGFLSIIFIILIIYAGFLWMTSSGDSGQVDKAKGILTSAIIGIIIILAAYIITDFVMTKVLESTTAAVG